MNKQVLSVEQMKHLQDLGLDTSNASMCWIKDTEGNRHLSVHDEYCYEASFMNPIPAYTLQDVLDALPEEITHKRKDYLIEMWKRDDEWTIGYLFFEIEDVVHLHDDTNKSLIDAAYELLVWCIENKFVETNKNE